LRSPSTKKGAKRYRELLAEFDAIFSANLLEAEVRATFRREGESFDRGQLKAIGWILPDRPLSDEIDKVLESEYVRGADRWHLATALYLSPNPNALTFLTLDERQKAAARAMGFVTP
jgi:hypothetical protein